MFSNLPGSCLDVVGVADCPTLRFDFENENVPITQKTSTDEDSTNSPFTNNGVITCLSKLKSYQNNFSRPKQFPLLAMNEKTSLQDILYLQWINC